MNVRPLESSALLSGPLAFISQADFLLLSASGSRTRPIFFLCFSARSAFASYSPSALQRLVSLSGRQDTQTRTFILSIAALNRPEQISAGNPATPAPPLRSRRPRGSPF